MLSRFIDKFRKPPEEGTSPSIPDGQRLYCVGDIHGRADLLNQLHEIILEDANTYTDKKTIVYLGDYVDRGEQSKQVIDVLLSQPLSGFETVFLLGNHEKIMLDFIDYPEAAASWLGFGGRETLNSYGIPLAYIPTSSEVPGLAEQLDKALPDAHREFMQNCDESWQCGSYYFVHAGIRPGVALDKQTLEDKLWVRDIFLQHTGTHDAIIVHGHSICTEPELLPNRIGIDTGAFATGVLSCLVLEGNQQRILQTNMQDG